ncbi:hypothetical protein F0562_020865 [Nyssa sinensis]|uniref:Uncharacterized protein n=1 Tax=Nyssa sinensis TaxID=561372 RepID=A0A5J5BSK4_9ASTE|nr:hypothetical protein F0562_020865 [Nyssa sinensis]
MVLRICFENGKSGRTDEGSLYLKTGEASRNGLFLIVFSTYQLSCNISMVEALVSQLWGNGELTNIHPQLSTCFVNAVVAWCFKDIKMQSISKQYALVLDQLGNNFHFSVFKRGTW